MRGEFSSHFPRELAGAAPPRSTARCCYVPLASPEPDANVETHWKEQVLYVCLADDEGAITRTAVFLLRARFAPASHESAENSP